MSVIKTLNKIHDSKVELKSEKLELESISKLKARSAALKKTISTVKGMIKANIQVKKDIDKIKEDSLSDMRGFAKKAQELGVSVKDIPAHKEVMSLRKELSNLQGEL